MRAWRDRRKPSRAASALSRRKLFAVSCRRISALWTGSEDSWTWIPIPRPLRAPRRSQVRRFRTCPKAVEEVKAVSGKNTNTNVTWARFFAVLAALALVVLMASAIFSTRNGRNTRQGGERLGPGERIGTFLDTMDKKVDRRIGSVL